MKKTIPILFTFHLTLLASFSGVIVDKTTNKPLENVSINDSKQSIKTSKNGSFRIISKEKSYFVKAYGYRPLEFNHDRNNSIIQLEPINVKALYLTFWGASNNSKTLKRILSIIKETEVNAIVVDVKNEYGSTSFLTSFDQANLYGAHHNRTNRNISDFMRKMKEYNIYTIARIVTFKDELQASNNPDYAILDLDGEIYRGKDKMAWVDPYDKRAHDYAISMAEEVAKVGFDEINFDYIRFPAKLDLKYAKEHTQSNRVKAIEDFLKSAQNRLRKYGVFISVDTYGNILWSKKDDNNIGQRVESFAKYADYLAPMLYPSGFSSGSFNVTYPSKHPYKVIYRSIANIKDKIDLKRVRPWLQYFKDYTTPRIPYKKHEINEQIRAADDVKTSGWMMWSPSSRYHKDYFSK